MQACRSHITAFLGRRTRMKLMSWRNLLFLFCLTIGLSLRGAANAKSFTSGGLGLSLGQMKAKFGAAIPNRPTGGTYQFDAGRLWFTPAVGQIEYHWDYNHDVSRAEARRFSRTLMPAD